MKRAIVRNQAGNAVIYVVLLLVIVGVLASGAWRIHAHKKKTATSSPTSSSPSASNGTQTAQSLTSGSDDASLGKDVTNIGNSLNEGGQNLQSAVNATNDESQVVSVPTD